MIEIIVQNLKNKHFKCNNGSQLLDAILRAGIDYMHACGGKGRCTTCKAVVVEGMEGLGELTQAEVKFQAANRLREHERLACQVYPTTSLVIRIPPENHLPHVDYGE